MDDPNPGWWKVDVNNRGGWQNRWWCYQVSAIVNGSEGQRTKWIVHQHSERDPMTIEELCKRREAVLEELAWIELEITRARGKENGKSRDLNSAVEYFPRVRGVSPE